jgi:hypothetical protein
MVLRGCEGKIVPICASSRIRLHPYGRNELLQSG